MSRPTPEPRERYVHFDAITTRWMDNDAYRHVNNVVYYSFFDTTVTRFMLSTGAFDLDSSPTVCLVVETGCIYFSPIGFPDVVHCGLRVAHLGSSSVRYEIGVFRNDERLASAQGFFVHVCCDRATHTPLPLPAGFRAALERLRLPAS